VTADDYAAPKGQKEVLADGIELYLGDCREILPTLGRVDALITDPPYGLDLGGQKDMRKGHVLAKEAYASYADTLDNYRTVIVPAIKASLSIASRGAVFSNNNLHELPKPDAIGGIYLPAACGRHRWGFNSFSPVAFYGTAPRLNFGSRPSAIKSTERADKNGHPCPKPLGWMTWIVDHASSSSETVLDPFMGSGTTGVAAVRLGRKFVGIELEPTYFDIACKRISDALKQPNLMAANG
jgi:site-specific DNA-methyltransferase (adenine-specific)/modification methylase